MSSPRNIVIPTSDDGLNGRFRLSVDHVQGALWIIPLDAVGRQLPELLDDVLTSVQRRPVILDLTRCAMTDSFAITYLEPERWGRSRQNFIVVAPTEATGAVDTDCAVTICGSIDQAVDLLGR